MAQPITLTSDSFAELYSTACKRVLSLGRGALPRGMTTYEIPAATLHLTDVSRAALPVGIDRRPNLAIGAIEALQLIGGVHYPEVMKRVTKNMAQFSDGGTFHGAYGPRVRPQLDAVAERIRQDPETRQAIITIWDPLHDVFTPGVHDYPCTVFLQFLVRGDRLELHAHMRSNDAWWGLAYDAFQFTQLQWTMAHVLGIEPGSYFHHATSLHVYEHDAARVEELLDRPVRDAPRVSGLVVPDFVAARQKVIRALEKKYYIDWYSVVLEDYL